MTEVANVDGDLVALSEIGEVTTRAYEMTLADFEAMKVAQRDTILFALLREQTAAVQALVARVDGYESELRSKLAVLSDPAARSKLVQELMGELTGGLMGGGLFGGRK